MAEETPKKTTIHEIEVEGYKFKVNTDNLDDVEALEFIDNIENKGQAAQVLPLLKFIIGDEEYRKLQDHFIKLDKSKYPAKNEDGSDYKPRMRMEYLNAVYLAIIEKFDPKG